MEYHSCCHLRSVPHRSAPNLAKLRSNRPDTPKHTKREAL
ncbi:hypothetical protein CKA32_003316 [Geitlerinema sp. FC II]|nr:hypothetical protein CKA32_003316 [Geitlerinema sp. FC II]